MSRIGRLFVRLVLVIAGFACGALAASTVLHLALHGLSGIDAPEAPWIALGSIALSIPFVALFVAYFAFLPAIVAIGIAEIAGWRGWPTYAFVGSVIAFVVMMIFRGALPDEAGEPVSGVRDVGDPRVLFALLAAGVAGGIAYWLVTGRSAGGWRNSPRLDAPPAP